MKKIIIVLLGIVTANYIQAQTEPKVFLNHLFFVLDSSTFNHLFDDNYVLEIGDTSIKSTTTTTASWTGKYLMGKQSYLEFFSSSSFKQVPEQGFGFGFMTYKSGDINQIKNNWKHKTTDSIETDTMIVPASGKLLPWFYDISLYTLDTLPMVSTWLMENTPDEFKSVGFTDEEIKQPISWQQYSEKRRHKLNTKPFDHISEVELVTNAKEYNYLKKSLIGFGLKDDGRKFYNDEVQIKYSIANVPSTKLKSVTIELDNALPDHEVVMNDHLMLFISSKTAMLKFNY